MDDTLHNSRTNFRQIRTVVEEQFKLQAQIASRLSRQETKGRFEEPQKPKKSNFIENKFEANLNFKITGDTFYKVIDLLNNKNIDGEGASKAQLIYEYLSSDVLYVNVRVNPFDIRLPHHYSSKSCSSESDHYMIPRQCTSCDYVTIPEIFDLTKLTKIKDDSFNELKDLHAGKVGSRMYYDRYKNSGIEKRHTSTNDQLAEANSSKTQGVFTEIVQSEYTYIAGLHYIYHNYILYFRGTQGKQLTKMEPFFLIFDQIFWKQSEFYKEFFSCKSIEDVASHFVDNVKLFKMYKNYILNLNTALNHLTNEYRFEILKRQQELGSPTSFEDYLLFPMRRLNEYVVLLEKSHSHLQRNEQMSSKVTVILGVFKKLLASSKADGRIVDSITNRPTSLVNYGSFIMKESFYVRKIRTTDKLMIFLFQDVIVFTAPEEGHVYSYKYHIPMKDLSIRVANNPISFEIIDFHGPKDKEKDMYVLETVDPKTKETWVEVIESLLWEQLIFYKNKPDADNVFTD